MGYYIHVLPIKANDQWNYGMIYLKNLERSIDVIDSASAVGQVIVSHEIDLVLVEVLFIYRPRSIRNDLSEKKENLS